MTDMGDLPHGSTVSVLFEVEVRNTRCVLDAVG